MSISRLLHQMQARITFFGTTSFQQLGMIGVNDVAQEIERGSQKTLRASSYEGI